jgi:hypothetical protein
MVTAQTERTPIGDVHCLNCGRSLAEVVRKPEDGKLALRPAIHQSDVQVVVAGKRLLRCRHCGGRAFIEMREDTPIEEMTGSAAPAERQGSPSAAGAGAGSSRLGWRVGARERPHARRTTQHSR